MAYVFTAIFGMSIMLIANTAFFVPGMPITDAQAVPRMASMLGTILGPFGVCAYSVGLLGGGVRLAARRVAERAVPLRRYLRRAEGPVGRRARRDHQGDQPPYRLGLLFITLVPLPLRLHRPAARSSSSTYTIIGSLFVPFLAATLLYLNNRVRLGLGRAAQPLVTNLLLVAILVLFAAVGAQEVMNAL